MATETLVLPGILELDFGAMSCRLYGKAFAGNRSHSQVVFSRISKTIMSFQSREMSNTSLSEVVALLKLSHTILHKRESLEK